MFFITFILFFVLVVMGRTFSFFKENSINSGVAKNVVHGTTIEIIWTVIPSVILIIVALPSFALLYSIDEMVEPALTIKCVGHQ
jgi:cytochrome c oxidase subunit 2